MSRHTVLSQGGILQERGYLEGPYWRMHTELVWRSDRVPPQKENRARLPQETRDRRGKEHRAGQWKGDTYRDKRNERRDQIKGNTAQENGYNTTGTPGQRAHGTNLLTKSEGI